MADEEKKEDSEKQPLKGSRSKKKAARTTKAKAAETKAAEVKTSEAAVADEKITERVNIQKLESQQFIRRKKKIMTQEALGMVETRGTYSSYRGS